MKKKQIKTRPNFRVDSASSLLCSDVIFALISQSLNSVSEIVYNFTRETKQLYFLSENLPINERRDMAKRAYLAKENAISLYHEIIDKRRFLQKYKKVGQTGLLYFETINKIRFLESRAYELDILMCQIKADIDVSIDKHAKFIDVELANQSKKLNDIMATFSLLTISCLPFTVIGGLMGMNVKVPFQTTDQNPNEYPFMSIIIITVVFSVLIYAYFHLVVFKK